MASGDPGAVHRSITPFQSLFFPVDSEVLSPPAHVAQSKAGHHVTSPTACQTGSDLLEQLPDAVRHILHGCGTPGAAIDRGAHITVYVTAADPSGGVRPMPRASRALFSRSLT